MGGIHIVTRTEDYYSDHDGGTFAPIEATTVATWKARAFLENLTVDAEGAVFVTVYSHNRVDRYDPATGVTTTFAEVPSPPMGLAFDAGGVLWMTSGALYEGPGFIWRVERTGAVRQWCELPDATFMNGCTMHPNGRTLLACESSSGHILAIDLGQPCRWDVWLQGDRLRPMAPKYPGSNGIKIRQGWAWISVSGRRLLVRAPIQPDGSAYWQEGTDELNQATAAVRAAKDAGVKHFIWSTLPDVEAISGGKFHVPHFTGKAKIDRIVKEAGFAHHTFVIAPFYYQNLVGIFAPQKQADGSLGRALPLDPNVRCVHMGDITELGNIVAGAFAHPDQAGSGEYLPLVGDFMSFNEIVDTLNRQGHKFSFKQVPAEVFAALFPGGAEQAEMCSYFQAHTYLGSDSYDRIALANKIAGGQPTKFSTWAQVNFPA